MASDGDIDKKEIDLIKTLCENSSLLKDVNFLEEINSFVNEINDGGKEFISNYFNLLSQATLTEKEELNLIDFAIQTIKADEKIEYSEIKFFKNIRHRLKIDDESILAVFPDIEMFLEQDIVTESFLDSITKQYLETTVLPQFELIKIDMSPVDDLNEDENA